MIVIKRNGDVAIFDRDKITNAILKAFEEVDGVIVKTSEQIAQNISSEIANEISDKLQIDIEDIQDMVENKLMLSNRLDVAKAYIKYRYNRQVSRAVMDDVKARYDKISDLIRGKDEESKKENSNKDTRIIPTMRDYIAGFSCRRIATDIILPPDVVEAHNKGIIHYHDTDYSPVMPMVNCGLINLYDMLWNGTVISGVKIDRPKSFRTACTITTQIITQVASSQYGGQSISLAHLTPFVQISREKIKSEVMLELATVYNDTKNISMTTVDNIVEDRLKKEIKDGVQTIQYQLITMSTTNGQSPFLTEFMYLNEVNSKQEKHDLAMIIEETLKQRIESVKNHQGVYVTIAFPKLIYVTEQDNIYEDSKYFYLTKLAAQCTATRLVPDYISEKKMKEIKEGNCFPVMGCRSALSTWKDENDEYKFYGRFNQGVVTINLPHVALSSNGDTNKFWELLDERLELCYKALMTRHNSLKCVKSDVAPILWQYGAYARLQEGETIDKLLYGGYSTISLGYAGLYETIKYLTNESQLQSKGYDLAIQIMQKLNNKCEQWKAETNLGFSVYGSPIENTTYKFAKALQRDFGIIRGITDKKYITNSYHITPSEQVDAFTKLNIESKFQELSSGGSISYIETPNMTKNVDVIIQLIQYMYDNIMYAEINTTTSYCQICGCRDLKMEDDLKFHCPNCGNDDFDKMNIALRVCGYISTNPFNEGRAEDIHSRVYHIDNQEFVE